MKTKKINKVSLEDLNVQSFITSSNDDNMATVKGGRVTDSRTITDDSGYHTCRSHFYTDCILNSKAICPTILIP